MAAAVFRAKFTVPSLPADQRPLPRLDRLWRRWRQARLITVTAAAGWGKTCFLARPALALGDRALWYTLDELDRDPAALVDHLAAACSLPASAAPPLERLAAIVGRLERCRLLVLDDVQTIATATATCAMIERLLRYMPAGCQLAIASREPVALSAVRLRARGESALVTAAELALTRQECAALLTRRLGRKRSAMIADQVYQLTEGWPTGLEIICQALGTSEPSACGAVLQRLVDGGEHWFAFFNQEVLADLNPATRRFLLVTSVLPHLEPDLCNRLTGRTDSAEVLTSLADRGLFTVRVGDHAWRYHPLLRASLHRRFEAEVSSVQRRRHRRQAAGLLAAEGEVETAALDLARSGDTAGAGTLLKRHARRLMGSQRPETLALALAEIPAAQVRTEPALLLLRAGLAQLHGRWDDAAGDLRLALRSGPPAAIGGALQAQQVQLALLHGRFEACLRTGRRALAQQPPLPASDRGVIQVAMGVAAASLGRVDQGQALMEQALAVARRRRDPVLLGRSLYLLAANVHYIRGDLAQALAAAQQAREIHAQLQRRDLVCHSEGVLGFVHAGLGDQTQARRSSLWTLQHAEAIGYRQIAGYSRLTLGACELLADEPAAALDRYGEACAIANDLGEDALATWAHLGLAEAAWRLGDRDRAALETARSASLAARRRDLFCLGRALAQQGRLAGRGEPERRRAAWQQAERILSRLGARLELARLRLWRAAAGDEDPDAVLAELAASDLAFLVERLETSLCESLRARGRSRSRGARTSASASEPSGQADGSRPHAAPPEQRAVAGPLHVRVLGPLEIDRGQAPLIVGPGRSRRVRRLLNLLLSARFKPLPRDQILEALWPAADPARTLVNLRQVVYQLRRLLEPPDATEPVHVIVEAETLRLDLGSGGSCDLFDFEAALGRARNARQERRHQDEGDLLQSALALWRGPYLADTPYDPGVDDIAATVRHQFLRAVERLLDLLAVDGQWEERVLIARRALTEDPLHEPFTRHLLEGLLHLGHRLDAQRVYTQYESRLVRELDLLPSSSLKDLAERAAGRSTGE